jgi:nitrate/nitrite transporter NarK
MSTTAIDARGLSRAELIENWAKAKGQQAFAKIKSREFQARVETAGFSVLAAGLGAVVPTWLLERNPDWQYLDEEKEIETEAVVGIVAAAGGVAAYVMEIDYGDALMVGGLVTGACYLNKVVREKARRENAEEAALAQQQRAAA